MNVGSLIAYLDLDDQNFDRKTKSANKQLDGLALHLKSLEKIKPELGIKTTKLQAEVKAVKDRLAELKAQAATGADVRVETAAAMFKLAALKAEMRSLHAEAAKTFKIEYDESGLRKLSNDLDGISKKLKGLGSGGLFGTALAFGPALAPFGGAAIGALGGITAAATEAVSAVGVLALALKGVAGASKAYQSYQTATGTANNAYAQALAAANSKSGKARTSAINSANQAHTKALGTAQFNLNQSAYGKSSAATQQFVKFDQTQLHPFGAGLMSSAQAGVLPGLTKGLQSLIKDAPQLNGAIQTIGTSVGHLMAEAGRALNSPFWKQWIVWFGKDSAKNVGTMGHSVGQLVEALARMDQRSGGAGKIVGDLDRLATRLNKWSASPAFMTFLDHIRNDEAQVSRFLKALWTDLAPILKGLTATGGAELGLLTGALSTISKLPTAWLETAGRMLPIIFLSMKLANGPLAAATKGLANLNASAATMAEQGMTKGQIALRGLGGAAKAAAGAGGMMLLLDGATRASGAIDTLELAAGGAATGLAVGGPFGAAIGGAVGGLVGLTKSLFDSGAAAHINYAEIGKAQALRDAKSGAVALAQSLDQVTGAYGSATRAAVLNQLESTAAGRAELAYLNKHGVTTTEAVSAAMGDRTAGKHANAALSALPKSLSSAQTNVSALQSVLDHGYNNGGRDTPLKGEDSLLKAMGLKATNGTYSDADIKNALRYQGDLITSYTSLQHVLGDTTQTLSAQQRQTRENAIATGDLSVKLLQTSDQLKTWPKQLLTRVSAVGTAQTMQGLLGIVDAARKMGMKNLSSGQAIAEATVIVNSDPSIAHTKENINAVANALRGIRPVNIPITADPGGFWATLWGLPGIGKNPAPTIKMGIAFGGIPALGAGNGKTPAHARGTISSPGGWAVVGEEGPEIVKLPRASQVVPHAKSMQMMRDQSGRSGYMRLHPDDIRTVIVGIGNQMMPAAHEVLANDVAYDGGY